MVTLFNESFWDERYGTGGRVWSGHPNPQLVAEASGLDAGWALDVGCGEGADSLWLAQRRWDVTGVDFSRVALQRAGDHAAGLGLTGSISWEHHDLLRWTPPASSFDLVTAQFMHLPKEERDPLFARLAVAVALGGTLLIVGHSASDIAAGAHRPDARDLYFTAAEVAAALDPAQWKVEVAEARPRRANDHGSEAITIHDEVMRARRVG